MTAERIVEMVALHSLLKRARFVASGECGFRQGTASAVPLQSRQEGGFSR